jgi:hypothetical protein
MDTCSGNAGRPPSQRLSSLRPNGSRARTSTRAIRRRRCASRWRPAVLRKDPNAALDWLARAYDAGFRDYAFLDLDPILAELKAQPRFRDVLDRMRKDVDAQRRRAEERGLLRIEGLLAPAK